MTAAQRTQSRPAVATVGEWALREAGAVRDVREVQEVREVRAPQQYGGQAVIEGVMIRGRQAMAVAVRQPSGEVFVHGEALDGLVFRSAWAKRPFIRGALLLWHSLTLGMRALMFSANVAMGDHGQSEGRSPKAAVRSPQSAVDFGPENGASYASAEEKSEAVARQAFGGGLKWGTLGVSLAFAIGLFFVVPVLLSRLVEPLLPAGLAVVATEAAIRVGLLLGYLWVIGWLPSVRRVFAYHGAEHKTINAFEAGEPLRSDRVAPYSVAHPRCGTTFVLYIVVVSAFVFSLLGRPALPVLIATRVLLLPLIAAVAYELIRFSGRRRLRPAVRVLLLPGLALQALTTREPDHDQIEVAIAALERVIALDGAAAAGRGEHPA